MRTYSRQQMLTPAPAVWALDELDEREVERQLFLFHLLNQAMGGPIPAGLVHLTSISTVLDVYCGAGGWTLDLACDYPHLQVTGIDTSERALASARRLAQEGGFTNVSFCAQDLCRPAALLDHLPGVPFDLIHTAFLTSHILRMDYPALLLALWQLCRPGGLVCWTEMAFPLTNSPALEQLMDLTSEALASAGQHKPSSSMPAGAVLRSPQHQERGAAMLSVGRRHLGLTPLLGTWFQQAGFQRVQQIPTAIDIAFASEAYACFTQQIEAFLRHIRPLLLAQEVTTPEALDELALQVKAELRQESFCGLCWLLNVLGHKPAKASASPH